MKVSLRPLLLASVAVLAPQISPATILAGYNSFPGGLGADEGTLQSSSTFSGSFLSNGGSTDGNYGPTVPVTGGGVIPGNPPTGNGVATLLGSSVNGVAIAPASFSISVLNTSRSAIELGYLLFDATTRNNPNQLLGVSYQISPPLQGPFPASQTLVDVGYTGNTNFSDFSIPLTGLILGVNQTFSATFFYTQINNVVSDMFVDNIALTAIPEPGSLFALGCLMGGGAFFRGRRRRA